MTACTRAASRTGRAVPQVRRGREAFEVLIANCKLQIELFPRDPNFGSEAKVGPNFLLKIVGAKSSIGIPSIRFSETFITFITFCYYRKQPEN